MILEREKIESLVDHIAECGKLKDPFYFALKTATSAIFSKTPDIFTVLIFHLYIIPLYM